MKKYLKIDKAIYEVDDIARTYKFVNRNFDWAKLSAEENKRNKDAIEGYIRMMEEKKIVNQNRGKLLFELVTKPTLELINNLSAKDATLKFTSSKALIKLSEENPEKIYPHFSDFVNLFDNENNIIKWTGIIIIGNLAKVDENKKIDKVLPKLFALLNAGKMITAGNATEALGKIALAKPNLAAKITKELLKVEKYQYDTTECHHIAVGHVIETFDLYLTNPDKKVLDFVKKETKNPRHSTAEKAIRYLKKI